MLKIYQKESSAPVIDSGQVGLISSHFLDTFFEAHGFALVVGLGAWFLCLAVWFLSVGSRVSLEF